MGAENRQILNEKPKVKNMSICGFWVIGTVQIRKLWFQHLVSIAENTGNVVPLPGKYSKKIITCLVAG